MTETDGDGETSFSPFYHRYLFLDSVKQEMEAFRLTGSEAVRPYLISTSGQIRQKSLCGDRRKFKTECAGVRVSLNLLAEKFTLGMCV